MLFDKLINNIIFPCGNTVLEKNHQFELRTFSRDILVNKMTIHRQATLFIF